MSATPKIIAADMPIQTSRYPLEPLLSAFRKLAIRERDVRLLLAGKRHSDEIFSVWNYLDQHELVDRVEFFPYYDVCTEFPVKKADCDAWIGRESPASLLNEKYLRGLLEGEGLRASKYALFFTCFHPEKQEGNSTLMQVWLRHLRRAGYKIHLVYYMYDLREVTADMRRTALRKYDLYREVPITSRLVGSNYNGLNVHVDDWCGVEAREAVARLAATYEYDVAIVNYAFMSAVFDEVAAYSKKILITHDSFADRNRRMLAQGYPESAWISLDASGEALACRRADHVVAVQEGEAEHFRALADREDKVVVVGTLMPRCEVRTSAPQEKLRIGYFGSSNWVNEQNLGEYLKLWLKDEALVRGSEILVAGGVCETLKDFVPSSVLRRVAPRMFGRVDSPADFFAECDVAINPERGGTGIKIKTLEALAHGCPIATTRGGSVGIGSDNRFHLAEDFAGLAALTAEIVADRALVETLREETRRVFDRYEEEQRDSLAKLLGPELPTPSSGLARAKAAPDHVRRRAGDLVVPEYVRETCADYHLEEFEGFLERVDIRGKDVLEIGSDYHLASARLFLANGARSVVATNIGNWRSDEPLPEGLEFRVCDVADADFGDRRFDVVYGIAILEHLPDVRRVCEQLERILEPAGVVYLQGCPLWTGSLGHHVYYSPDEAEPEATFSKGGGKKRKPILYSFTENNPVPNWAHLVHSPEELRRLLVDEGVEPSHAGGIIRQIYDLDGIMAGSCSNFLPASRILEMLGESFSLEVERITTVGGGNEYFHRARSQYSEEDLRTLGLRVWMSPLRVERERGEASEQPTVSVIIPFYNVEEFFAECLDSVVSQSYPNLEILLVDDASPDGSRKIAEAYAARDERIVLLTHEENRGLGPARNTGAARASGAYLLFLDSDDYFSTPQAVSVLVEQARSSGAKVVVGSCQRLMPDGSFADFDRQYDATRNGTPDQVVDGEQAFLGASFLPGGRYVPMRAWGALIERFLYDESGLTFPASAHEDLPHTPFLYYCAGSVLYISDVVVTYRQRAASISNTQWGENMIRRYADMWGMIEANLERFGLQRHAGNTAVKTSEHLVMKLRLNGLQRGAEQAAIETLQAILRRARGDLDEELFFYTMDSLRSVLDLQKYDHDLFRRITGELEPTMLIRYYRDRLGGGFVHYGPLPIREGSTAVTSGVVTRGSDAGPSRDAMQEEGRRAAGPMTALEVNQARMAVILREYREKAAGVLDGFPSMLTEGDKALYYHAGRHFRFEGSIVDAGCFLGGTTMSLVQGLLANMRFAAWKERAKGLIRVYDLFEIDDDYILEHLRKNYPRLDFSDRSSFLDLFEENLEPHGDLLDVRPGDITVSGYADPEPIEVLGVDVCKALPVTDYVVRNFFTRLLPGALVIQQDFIHEFHPHIHLSMLKLEDHFEKYAEVRWGGSVAYRCTRPITPGVVVERFGEDSSWYEDVIGNALLLRRLATEMLYEENRWIITLTLGIYYWAMKRQERAGQIYREARNQYPDFEPLETTKKLIGAV